MRYRIVEAKDVEGLEQDVNEAIGEGWQPLGGVSRSELAGEYLRLVVLSGDGPARSGLGASELIRPRLNSPGCRAMTIAQVFTP